MGQRDPENSGFFRPARRRKKKDVERELKKQQAQFASTKNEAKAANCRPAIRNAAVEEAHRLNINVTTSTGFADTVQAGVRARLADLAVNPKAPSGLRDDLHKNLKSKTWPSSGTIRKSIGKKR